MLQPRVILKTLGQAFQIVVREAGGSLRMNQPGVLGKSRRRVHYNIKSRCPDLSNGGAAYCRISAWRHSWKLSPHASSGFLRRPTKEQ
jgi:hypothetical protein